MKWEVKNKATPDFLNKFPEFNPIVLQLLFNRNLLAQDQIDHFLTLDYSQDQHDPFLFKEMAKVCQRIEQAKAKQEKVVVHGDYDADGVCASAIMMQTLKKLGIKNLDIYIPHRESEGYGLNKATIEYFAEQKVKLVITVDCGIANKDEVALARDRGIEVIITDHHAQPLAMPEVAYAIINPQVAGEIYPTNDLSGAGVAFKVAQALIKRNNLGEAFEKWMLDLVAISLITDCINLIGESRLFAYYGLKVLRKTIHPGLRELLIGARRQLEDIDTQGIGFQIGPRLNAAGRMDHANSAYQLLMTDDRAEAKELAAKIEANNKARQKMSEDIYQQAEAQVQEQREEKFFCVKGEDWSLGLVGLVAGKIADKYYRPTLVLTQNGQEISGSGRSVEEFNMIEALKKMEDLFARYGGHSQACGFTLKEGVIVEDFKDRFKEIITAALTVELEKKIKIEAEINLDQVNWDLITELDKFEPFGEGNPKPLFVSRNLEVERWDLVGKNQNHLRLAAGGKKMIGFKLAQLAKNLRPGDKIDVVYEVGVNRWNGSQEIQLKIEDFKLCE